MKVKRKVLSNFLILTFSLLFLFSFTTIAYANTLPGKYSNVDTSEKVYDYADLLTDNEEKTLKNEINKMIDKYEHDIFIVTIDDNPFRNTEIFINDFGDYNGFGLGENQSYIACVIDMDYREVYIDTVGDCIDTFDDLDIDSMLDKISNSLSNGNYNKAAKQFLKEINSEESVGGRLIPALLKGILSGMIIGGIVTFLIARQSKTIKKATEASKYTSAPLELTQSNDLYVRTYETKVPRNTNSGGSSTHRSSSGRSHGGGGRKF